MATTKRSQARKQNAERGATRPASKTENPCKEPSETKMPDAEAECNPPTPVEDSRPLSVSPLALLFAAQYAVLTTDRFEFTGDVALEELEGHALCQGADGIVGQAVIGLSGNEAADALVMGLQPFGHGDRDSPLWAAATGSYAIRKAYQRGESVVTASGAARILQGCPKHVVERSRTELEALEWIVNLYGDAQTGANRSATPPQFHAVYMTIALAEALRARGHDLGLLHIFARRVVEYVAERRLFQGLIPSVPVLRADRRAS